MAAAGAVSTGGGVISVAGLAVVGGRAAVDVAGGGVGGAARSAVRACDDREGEADRAGGRTGAVCGLAGVGTGAWSAGRVTVPRRLKFCSSLGPIVFGEGEFEVGGGGAGVDADWASAAAGATVNAVAANVAPTRKIAFIRSRSQVIAAPRRAPANARRVPFIQAVGG